MGDLNAKIGSDNKGYEKIMGHEGLGVTNDDEDIFANMCPSTISSLDEAFFHTDASKKQPGVHVI